MDFELKIELDFELVFELKIELDFAVRLRRQAKTNKSNQTNQN